MEVLVAILVGYAAVSVAALQCNSSYTWYKWASNAKAQDPCQLASLLRTSCVPDADLLPSLSYNPSGTNYYPGPDSSLQNACTCSYVMYNLMAACGDCQVGFSVTSPWPTYHAWAQSCDPVNSGGIYPDALPNSFKDYIPTWARFSTKESGDSRWSYGLSHAVASGHVLVNQKVVPSASDSCQSTTSSSPGLPIGTAFAGFFVGLLIAFLGLFLQRKRRAHVIPPPTRYHTAPDNTPLVPLMPRPAHAHGTNFLRRMLEHEHENDPRRIEPFDISSAVQSFPPHPAVFPPRREHAFPPTSFGQAPSRGPSRQSSYASLNPIAFAAHPAVGPLRPPLSKSQPRPVTSPFSSAESPVAGTSAGPVHDVLPMHEMSPSEPPSPSPQDHAWETPEEPPAYRRKS